MAGNLAAQLRLILVADDRLLSGREFVALCRDAVAGGVTAVQLRCKSLDDSEIVRLGRVLVAELPVPIFINDRLDLALVVGAHGAHLGSDDLSPALARRVAPPGFIIGASVGSDEEVPRGMAADYWGIGPLRATDTKADAGSALGLEGARRILAQSVGRPGVLIGSVVPADVPLALAAGFAGVAVASGILKAEDLTTAARRYR
jgi:thiamine-phosphate diphosphorylase